MEWVTLTLPPTTSSNDLRSRFFFLTVRSAPEWARNRTVSAGRLSPSRQRATGAQEPANATV
jgi:hypothetical protein